MFTIGTLVKFINISKFIVKSYTRITCRKILETYNESLFE